MSAISSVHHWVIKRNKPKWNVIHWYHWIDRGFSDDIAFIIFVTAYGIFIYELEIMGHSSDFLNTNSMKSRLNKISLKVDQFVTLTATLQ